MAIEVNGKTYRTLEEQVYYLTEKVSEIQVDTRAITQIDFDEPTSVTVEGEYLIYDGDATVTYDDESTESISFSYYAPKCKVQSVNNKTGAVVLNGTDIKTNAVGVSKTVKDDIDNLYEQEGYDRDDIEALESGFSDLGDAVDALELDVATLENDVDALENRMDTAENDIDVLETEMSERPIVTGEYTGDNWTEITIGSTTKNIGGGGSDIHLYRHTIKLVFGDNSGDTPPFFEMIYITIFNNYDLEYEEPQEVINLMKGQGKIDCNGGYTTFPGCDFEYPQAIQYDEDIASFVIYGAFQDCDEAPMEQQSADIEDTFLDEINDYVVQIF